MILRELSLSPFAIPSARGREIGGETAMGWTEFYAAMCDGREFRFGTTFLTEFFDMPEGYTASDVVRNLPAVRGAQPRAEKLYQREAVFYLFCRRLIKFMCKSHCSASDTCSVSAAPG